LHIVFHNVPRGFVLTVMTGILAHIVASADAPARTCSATTSAATISTLPTTPIGTAACTTRRLNVLLGISFERGNPAKGDRCENWQRRLAGFFEEIPPGEDFLCF
jgi:hypothetical protein